MPCHKTPPATRCRAGFSLLELIVVIAILALLAALAIPKLIDMIERSGSATQAFSTADVARQVEMFFGLNGKYPDGWDTLMSSDDESLLYSKLNGELTEPSAFLTTAQLTNDQIDALHDAGIGHVFLHDSTTAASNSGTDRRHFGTGQGHDGTPNINTVAVIDKTTGSQGLDLLINGFGLNPNRSASDTTLPRITANTYVVLGLGPKSTLVQTQIQEAPLLQSSNTTNVYGRALAVFEVANVNPRKAKLVGVFGPDGRSKNMAISDFHNISGVQPH